MASAVVVGLRGRGVHWAEYLIRGRPVLLAIDSRGELVKRVRLARDEDEEFAREWLAGLIEHYDPPRRLQLVKPPAPAAAPAAAPSPTPAPARAFKFYLPRLR